MIPINIHSTQSKHPSLVGALDTSFVAGASLFIYMCNAIIVYAKEIKLTQGKVALVGWWWYDWLNMWKWCASKSNNHFYAKSGIIINGKRTTMYMHVFIMHPQKGKLVDHRHGNTLNNCESELRIVTKRQNNINRIGRGSSLYMGVSYCVGRNKWEARLKTEDGLIIRKRFVNETDAALFYNQIALEHHGEFARLNKI